MIKILQNRSKNAFEAKGRLYTTGMVNQLVFHIDLYTYLEMYRYGWGKRQIQYICYKITIGYTHRLCGFPVVTVQKLCKRQH